MPFSWTNWRAHTRRQLRIRGVPALGEALWRGALGAAIDLGWALEPDAPLPEKVVVVVGDIQEVELGIQAVELEAAEVPTIPALTKTTKLV